MSDRVSTILSSKLESLLIIAWLFQFVVFVTIVPKTPEQQKDVVQLLHDVRPAWLALSGSLSHGKLYLISPQAHRALIKCYFLDVGTAKDGDELGTVYLTEICKFTLITWSLLSSSKP